MLVLANGDCCLWEMGIESSRSIIYTITLFQNDKIHTGATKNQDNFFYFFK